MKNFRKLTLVIMINIFVTGILSLLFVNQSDAAKLYKWIDEDGRVSYSDKIPPSEIKRKHNEINERGIIVKSITAAKTAEQLAEEKRQQAIKERQERLAKQQAEKDQLLLDTFTSEQQLIEARDRKIAMLTSVNQVTNASIKQLKENLQIQMKQAASHERNGDKVPEVVLGTINNIKQNIKVHQASIADKQSAQMKLQQRYNGDISRFRELKAKEKE